MIFTIIFLTNITSIMMSFNPLIQVNDFYLDEIEERFKTQMIGFNPLIQVNDFFIQR